MRGSEPTILVVDDNKEVLEFLLLLLSKHGLSVIGASSGNQCLDIVKSRAIGLIILDVMMPAMDGLEVCQELKRLLLRHQLFCSQREMTWRPGLQPWISG